MDGFKPPELARRVDSLVVGEPNVGQLGESPFNK
jgi:hypothetical protein